MNIDILNMNEFIAKNELKEITTSNIFVSSSSEPDPEGLASYQIFGNPGTPERANTFAYVELGDIFVHPHCFFILVSLKQVLKDLILGEGKFYIKDGVVRKLVNEESAPTGVEVGTGVKFLYDNFSKINFDKEIDDIKESSAKDKRDFIKALSRNEIFITKFVVIPPFYRDVDLNKRKKNDLNILYARLINLASSIKGVSAMFSLYETTDAHRKITETINELYLYFVKIVGGTKGFIHLHVMGKTTDYSARLVITTPKINSNRPEDMEVSFDKSAIPLHAVIKCFAPFIVYGVKKFFNTILSGSKYVYMMNGKNVNKIELANYYMEDFSSENIHKLIRLYFESKEHRLDTVTILGADGARYPILYVTEDGDIKSGFSENEIVTASSDAKYHPLTLLELFYIVAFDTVSDKCAYITRYPIEDYHNIYPTKINIIPCNKTKSVVFNSVTYPKFPSITNTSIDEVDTLFTDSLRLFPAYLKALGADFDGDMCSVQGVFTKDANQKAKEYIYSPTNIINIAGNTVRTTGDVTAHTVFALTRRQ